MLSKCTMPSFLFVMADSSMSWEHHIDTICCTISSRLSLLRLTKPYLNFDSALRFYNSCVINYFIYCSTAWRNCSHHLLLWLLRLQKRSGCILLDANFSSASLSLFLKLKRIPVFYLIKYRKAFLLFSNLRNPNAPNYLRNRFQFLSDSRGPLGRYIRASLFNLKVPYPQGNSGKRALAYSATKLFNELSSDLKEFSTYSSPPTFKFLPSFHKSNLRNLFLSRLYRLCRTLERSTVLDLLLLYLL